MFVSHGSFLPFFFFSFFFARHFHFDFYNLATHERHNIATFAVAMFAANLSSCSKIYTITGSSFVDTRPLSWGKRLHQMATILLLPTYNTAVAKLRSRHLLTWRPNSTSTLKLPTMVNTLTSIHAPSALLQQRYSCLTLKDVPHGQEAAR